MSALTIMQYVVTTVKVRVVFLKVRFIKVQNWSSVRLSCLNSKYLSQYRACSTVVSIQRSLLCEGVAHFRAEKGQPATGRMWLAVHSWLQHWPVGNWGLQTKGHTTTSVFLFKTATSSIFNCHVSDLFISGAEHLGVKWKTTIWGKSLVWCNFPVIGSENEEIG